MASGTGFGRGPIERISETAGLGLIAQANGLRPRVGLLGGSFDPVHIGHVALARTAMAALQLNQLRWIPVGNAWQKSRPLTPARDRSAMLEAAISSLPERAQMHVDDLEIRRSGAHNNPTYTLDTLITLRALLGPQVALILILGSDQLRNLYSWHRYAELTDFAHLAVTQREQVSLQALPAPVEALVQAKGAEQLPDTPAGSIVFFTMPPVIVSATQLRAELALRPRPEHVGALLPPGVLPYIDQHQLYREGSNP